MITPEERTLFGLLGKIPNEVLHGPAGSGQRWKALSDKAVTVSRIRDKQQRIHEAKLIENEYRSLIADCDDFIRRSKNGKS